MTGGRDAKTPPSLAQGRRQGGSRRAFLLGAAACLAPIAARASLAVESAREKIAAIEAREGGRLGVALVDTASGASFGYRDDERFPMCSTFKLLAAAAALKRVDDGAERLDRVIAYTAADLLDYAPVAKAHVAQGGMSVADLCAAAIAWSDNTAGNLVLQSIGGPTGFTRFARSLGDSVTRLDRIEPALNASTPGDERDTTSPRAMLSDMRAVLTGSALSQASRQQLESWLVDDKVGDKRLRAGLPASWRVGDKTGSGDNGSANTIAILRPPGRAPLLAAVYFTGSTASIDARNAVHKEIGALIAETF
jgi:beta-lactamase class A